jgi:DedD protein
MMERTLKERIIGAIVLVIFVVLVVPVFLDGPPEGGDTVSERILLPGQEGQDTKTVVLNRERDEPIPAANREENATTSSDAAVPAPIAERPVPEPIPETPPARIEAKSGPEPQPEAAKPAASTTGMWAVQLGSFSNKQNAEKQAADLRKQGYAAFLSQLKTDSGQFHRVRIGPQKDRESAEAMAARLLKVGHKGQVLPHP